MMYYETLADGAEISHSDVQHDGTVLVCVERADAAQGRCYAVCCLPEGRWTEVRGFSAEEMARYHSFVAAEGERILLRAQAGLIG